MAKKAEKTTKEEPKELSAASVAARLRALRASIDKEFGANTMQTFDGSNLTQQNFEYQIPSGSIGLDIALGPVLRQPDGSWQTGFAPGKIVEVIGPESCGKSTECNVIVANAHTLAFVDIATKQRKNPNFRAFYADMEHTWDPAYAKRLGCDVSRIDVVQPDTGEDCMNIVEMAVGSGLYAVVVVDSVAALIPKSERDGDVGDASMGAQARLMSQALRKVNPILTKSKTLLVFVNQIRHKIGVMYGNPETTPGGNALKFYASYRIDLRRKETLKDGDEVYGHVIEATVFKNKVAPPYRKAKFELVYGRGFDKYTELVDLCLGRNILVADSAWITYGGKPVGQGRFRTADKLRTDGALAYELYDKLMTMIAAERGFYPDGRAIPGFSPEEVQSGGVASFVPLSDEEKAAIERDQEDEAKFLTELNSTGGN
jgi:recombination protein RecA